MGVHSASRIGKSGDDAVRCFENAEEAYKFIPKETRTLDNILEYQKILYCKGLTADFQISKTRSYLRDKRHAQDVASQYYHDLLETNFNVPGFWLRAKEFIDSKLGCFREIGNAELAAACQLNYDRLMRGESAIPIAHKMGKIDKNQYQNVSTSIRSAVEPPQQVVDYQNASTSTRSAVQPQPEIDYQNASTSTRLTPAVPPVIFTPLPRSTSSAPTAANHKRHHEDAVDDRELAALDEQIAEQERKLQKLQESRNSLLAKKMKPN